jgi:hypothetical protein
MHPDTKLILLTRLTRTLNASRITFMHPINVGFSMYNAGVPSNSCNGLSQYPDLDQPQARNGLIKYQPSSWIETGNQVGTDCLLIRSDDIK